MAERTRLGDLAVARGFVTREELDDALRTQAELFREGKDRPLGGILVEKGYLRESQLESLLKAQETAGKKTIGPYELVARLGEGGMGAVYKARDERTGGFVGIKILPRRLAQDAQYVKRFQREGRLGLGLDHANVVKTLEVGEEQGPGGGRYHYMAMEYIEGPDLDKILKRRGHLPEKEALEIALSVARALNHAHEHELIHRDVKPANVLLARDGRVLLADLGLARSTAEDATRVTVTGTALGSPHYISPEQARGGKDIDCRTDIYSLGAMLYHMLTGRVPFEGGTAAVVVAKHLTEELPNPRDLVPELSEAVSLLVARMMAKRPENRHADPAELVADIYQVLAGEDPAAALDLGLSSVRPPAAEEKRRRETRRAGMGTRERRRAPTVEAAPVEEAERRRKLLVLLGAGGACAVLLGGVLAVALGGKGEPPVRLPRRRPRVTQAPPRGTREPIAEKPAGTREAGERDLPAPPGAPTARVEERAPTGQPPAPTAEVEPSAGPGRRVPAPAAPAERAFEIPPGYRKSVVVREDFEGEPAAFKGGAITHDNTYRSSRASFKATLDLKGEHFSCRLAFDKWTVGKLKEEGIVQVGKDTVLAFAYYVDGSEDLTLIGWLPAKKRNFSVTLKKVPRRTWNLAQVRLLDFRVHPGGTDPKIEIGDWIQSLTWLAGRPGEPCTFMIDDVEIYDVVPVTSEDVAKEAAERKRREEEARRAAEELARTRMEKDAREREQVYRLFLGDFRALLRERRYAKAAELAGDFPDERAAAHARDAVLLKGYLARALANARAATGKRVKVCGIGGTLVRVEGEELTIRARGLEGKYPFSRLSPEEVIGLAELAPPPERFAMRALFYYAEGDVEKAKEEVRGQPGEVAERVKRLLGLARAPVETTKPPPAAEEWITIFNGRDLTEWKKAGGGKAYVEDGALVSEGGTDLYYPADWDEFVLECETKGAGKDLTAPFVALGLAQHRLGRGSQRVQVWFHGDGDVHVRAGGKRLWRSGGSRVPITAWVRVRLELTKDSFKLYAEGKLLGSASVSGLGAEKGGIYFYSFGSGYTSWMRNARVRVIAPPP